MHPLGHQNQGFGHEYKSLLQLFHEKEFGYDQIEDQAASLVEKFSNANLITGNYNQGILIVEGSSAQIIANKIESNNKANVALGGEHTGKTKIMYN